MRLLLVRFIERREITAVLQTVKRTLGLHSDIYEWIWFKFGHYCTLHPDNSLIDLDIDSRSQECEKAKTCVSIISQSLQLISVDFGILLRLVGVMKHILILPCPFTIHGRVYYLYEFIKKKKKTSALACLHTFSDFKLGLMRETTRLYIWISVWMTLTFSQGDICIRNQKCLSFFCCKFNYQFG